MGSGGACGGRGGVRRMNSNIAVVAGGVGGRQVVVPSSRMARLTRATSEQQKLKEGNNTRGDPGNGHNSARRSLFNGSGERSTPVQRSNTSGRSKRKRSCDVSSAAPPASPCNPNKKARLHRTPRDERKRRASLRVDIDSESLGMHLFTPTRKGFDPSSRKNRGTPINKKGTFY